MKLLVLLLIFVAINVNLTTTSTIFKRQKDKINCLLDIFNRNCRGAWAKRALTRRETGRDLDFNGTFLKRNIPSKVMESFQSPDNSNYKTNDRLLSSILYKR